MHFPNKPLANPADCARCLQPATMDFCQARYSQSPKELWALGPFQIKVHSHIAQVLRVFAYLVVLRTKRKGVVSRKRGGLLWNNEKWQVNWIVPTTQ